MKQLYDSLTTAAVEAVKLSPGVWIALIAGLAVGLLMAAQGNTAILFGLVIAGIAGAFFWWKHNDLGRQREEVREAWEKEHQQADAVLKASLAELADYRREVAAEDARSETVNVLLQSLSSPQFVLQRPEQRVAVA
jgi:hypothetical protein